MERSLAICEHGFSILVNALAYVQGRAQVGNCVHTTPISMFPVIEGSWLPLCNPEKVSMAHGESCIGSHEAHFNCSSVHVQHGLVMHYEDVLLHFNFLRVPVEVNMKN
jgi:hypothetical protein